VRLLVLQICLLVVALTGCGAVGTVPAPIDRFVQAPRGVTEEAFAKAAAARGYRDLGKGVWQRVLSYEKDPVFGLVQISDRPAYANELHTRIESVDSASCRISVDARHLMQATRLLEPKLLYWQPGNEGYQEAVGIVESAVAFALERARQLQPLSSGSASGAP